MIGTGTTFRITGTCFRITGTTFRITGSAFRFHFATGSAFRITGSTFRLNRNDVPTILPISNQEQPIQYKGSAPPPRWQGFYFASGGILANASAFDRWRRFCASEGGLVTLLHLWGACARPGRPGSETRPAATCLIRARCGCPRC